MGLAPKTDRDAATRSRLAYELGHASLIAYLRHKMEIADWHGVSDAANDLRVLEAQESSRLACAGQAR